MGHRNSLTLMLHFEGDTDLAQPPHDAWAKLSDARFLVQCVPGVEKVVQAEPGDAKCVLRPGLSFVRGTLEVTAKIVEAVVDEKVRIACHGKGIGSSNDLDLALAFAPKDAGTRIHWIADVKNLSGLLRAVPSGLLQAAAQKVIAQVWDAAKKKLEEKPK